MAIANCLSPLHHGWCYKDTHPHTCNIRIQKDISIFLGGAETLLPNQIGERWQVFAIRRKVERGLCHSSFATDGIFEIWVIPVKLFSVTSQPAVISVFKILRFGAFSHMNWSLKKCNVWLHWKSIPLFGKEAFNMSLPLWCQSKYSLWHFLLFWRCMSAQ